MESEQTDLLPHIFSRRIFRLGNQRSAVQNRTIVHKMHRIDGIVSYISPFTVLPLFTESWIRVPEYWWAAFLSVFHTSFHADHGYLTRHY